MYVQIIYYVYIVFVSESFEIRRWLIDIHPSCTENLPLQLWIAETVCSLSWNRLPHSLSFSI